jgi:outer membrane protease
MDDYDWLYDSQDWTDHSNHPNTKLVSADILNVLVLKNIKHEGFDLSFGIGVKKTTKKLKAYDGSYTYTSSKDNFRDQTGDFNGLGITYSEEFSSVYGSAEISTETPKWRFLAGVNYSPVYNAKSSDTHHFRNFTNNNVFEGNVVYGFGLGINYAVAKDFNLGVSFERSIYTESKGITTRVYDDIDSANKDKFTQLSTSYEGAGISNNYSLLNIYLKYSF